MMMKIYKQKFEKKVLNQSIIYELILVSIVGMSGLINPSLANADQQDPLNFIVGVSQLHDDNLFRSATNTRSEDVTSAYAGIRLDKQYAQQRFKFDFTLATNRYQNFDVLNYTSNKL